MPGTETIIEGILRREGGWVDHPADRGGPTKYGITLRTLSRWRGSRAIAEDVRALTKEQARRIYRHLYIEKPGFDRIEDPRLRELVIDCAVHHSPARAVRWLQKAAGVKVDGRCGPVTLGAANAAPAKSLADSASWHRGRARSGATITAQAVAGRVRGKGWMMRLAKFIEKEEA